MSGYNLGEVLRGQLQSQSTQPQGTRDIETITGEILEAKRVGGEAIITIGQRLIEAKALLQHGEWLPWLTERVEYSEKTAQNFMRLARQWSNPQALADLGATKALTLLALPPEERDSFMAENHLVDGEEKNVIDMTSRELQKAIQERNDAIQAAEAAKANAQAAEDSRAKIEADMKVLESIHRAAQEGEANARQELEAVRAELQALRDKPVDVAVQTVVDEEAIKKARDEAVAAMKAKVDAAETARKAAEDKRKAAERDLAEAKKQAGANAAILSRAEKAEAELAEARRQLEAAVKQEKRTVIASDPDVATFQIYFNQVQENVNKLRGLLLKARGREDQSTAEKLTRAILALGDAVKGAAE